MPRRAYRWWCACLDDGDPPAPSPEVDVWIPQIGVRKLEGGNLTYGRKNAFPGYFFVGSFLSWQEVERRTGVRLLRQGGSPVALAWEEVCRVRGLEDTELNFEPAFSAGQPVHIVKGVFSRLTARFLRIVSVCGGRWAQVEVDLCGQDRVVEQVPLDYLEGV